MDAKKLLSYVWPFVVLVGLFCWSLASSRFTIIPQNEPLRQSIAQGRLEDVKKELELSQQKPEYRTQAYMNMLLHLACQEYSFNGVRNRLSGEKDQSSERGEIIRLIVQKGANMDYYPENPTAGYSSLEELGSPLAYAVHHDNVKLYRLLRELGADPKTPNKFGPTLFFALGSHRGKNDPPSVHDGDIIDALIKDGVDITCRDRNGRTVAHLAAGMWSTHVARCLIERGIDVNVKDKMGITPLDCVSDKAMKELFLKAGAKPGGKP